MNFNNFSFELFTPEELKLKSFILFKREKEYILCTVFLIFLLIFSIIFLLQYLGNRNIGIEKEIVFSFCILGLLISSFREYLCYLIYQFKNVLDLNLFLLKLKNYEIIYSEIEEYSKSDAVCFLFNQKKYKLFFVYKKGKKIEKKEFEIYLKLFCTNDNKNNLIDLNQFKIYLKY